MCPCPLRRGQQNKRTYRARPKPPASRPCAPVPCGKANGTDAAFITAKIVDAQGNLCPTASDNVTWNVSGPGNYRGGSDAYVTAGKPLGYHSPLDPELAAEGVMCKVAVRSTFTPGTVTVTATYPGLGTGTATFPVVALGATAVTRPAAFSAGASIPDLKMAMKGATLRYYLSRTSYVAFEIIDANGRLLERIAGSRQAEGWHPIQLAGAANNGETRGSGVFFVHCAIDGSYQCVKRVLVVR